MLDWFKRVAKPGSGEHLGKKEDQPTPDDSQVDRLASRIDTLNKIVNTEQPVRTVPRRMRVIVVASQKGGVGKTTITAHLAVCAGKSAQRSAVLIDTDPQGSLTEWWEARRERLEQNGGLALVTVKRDELASKLIELDEQGTATAIIDTPPALTAEIDKVIAMADFVIIPARPSPHDLRAIGATVSLVRRAKKPFMFIVNGAVPRANITAEAVAALSEHGRVAPVILYQRTDYAASMIDGRTVMEAGGPTGRSAQEIADLWRHVDEQLNVRAAA